MTPLSSDEAYRQAGVDLKRAEAVVDLARQAAGRAPKTNLLGGIGGFSGAFEIPAGYRQPVLLSACDGVGTKLKLAFLTGRHDTVGIDLVAMSVNDLLVNGGQPLVFLDYFATDQIRPEILEPVLAGIAEGCAQAGCALAGGETAEMPGLYSDGEYDLAGFAVGVVEKDRMLPRLDVLKPGDVLVGLASSGLHSNGYSLVRKIILSDHRQDLNAIPEGWNETLADALLTPTRIYINPVLNWLSGLDGAIKAMVHVTGGGFYDNIPRVLSPGVSARVAFKSWDRPAIFPYLQTLGGLTDEAMAHTFNCGIGMVLVVSADQVESVLNASREAALPAWMIGELVASAGASEVVLC
jgi:phosphoribosylformylglycinamidine cyclo-ligase